MSDHVHWRKAFNPDFLGEWDLVPGQDKILTVKSVGIEECTFEGGRKENKTVIHWVENEKPMIVNATNGKTIVKLTGSKFYDGWDGIRLQIYFDPSVKGKSGEVVGGLRIRNKIPEEVKIACDECGQFISPAFNMTAAQMAAYTKKKYGKQLCAECAKAKKGAENNGADK